jgi:hypothetical protein
MEDLEKMAAQHLAAVREMPPGQRRQDALKEIGRLRSRMHRLPRQAAKSKSSEVMKDDHASTTAADYRNLRVKRWRARRP